MTIQIKPLVPEFWCSDFEASLAFYTRVLGFSVVQRRGDDRHAYLELGDAQIMLANWEQDGSWETAKLESPFGRGINFQIIVDDVEGLCKNVLSEGVKPFVEIYTMDYWRTDRMDKRTEFAVQDPDGYLLRFTQIVSHRAIQQSDLDKLDKKS